MAMAFGQTASRGLKSRGAWRHKVKPSTDGTVGALSSAIGSRMETRSCSLPGGRTSKSPRSRPGWLGGNDGRRVDPANVKQLEQTRSRVEDVDVCGDEMAMQ
jgi:hypothetical protein